MKILDKYLLKQFIGTFATVFVILFFIFILQTVWLFISELAGKDLDIVSVFKFLLFATPRVIPLVLPLSVLLASIMTFGSLAENYEFAAMKSAGISLQRAMRNLIYFICLLSVITFFFANNVIPYAEYKFINFRRNIAQVKPAMAIAEGQFSQVGTYNIKVEKKSGENGKNLTGVTIHQLSAIGAGSNTVIKAKKGELVSSENSNILKLVLKDGNYYEDIIPKKFEERNKVPFAKSEFKRYVINIDLSKLKSNNLDEGQITNTNTMLTVGELKFTLDSLRKNYNKDLVSIVENINQRSIITSSVIATGTNLPTLSFNNVLQNFSDNDKAQTLRVASSTIDATNFTLESSRFELQDKRKNINMHWIALYDKFVIAFACLLMFFIGAPLGAIIRKGGLGLPIVFAILIFITFHFINTFGKKVAQEDGITPFLGCWMSTFVLAPLAIVLTKRATEDRGVNINFDWITNIYNRFVTAKKERKFVSNSINSSDIQSIKIGKKNITIDYPEIKILQRQYQKYTLIALTLYIVLFVLIIYRLENVVLQISAVLTAIVFNLMIYKSQTILKKIGNQTDKKIDLQNHIVILGSFPFYPLFFLYNRIYLKQLLSLANNKFDGQ